MQSVLCVHVLGDLRARRNSRVMEASRRRLIQNIGNDLQSHLQNGKGKKKRYAKVLLFTLADNGIVIVYNNLPKSTAGRFVLLHLATKK